jgi:hypothetical protein
MKISKLLFALVLGLTMVSCSNHRGENHEKVTQSAKNAFDRGYPGATDAKWSVEENGNFEVEFKYNYTNYEVTYDPKGTIIEVEYVVDSKYLPEGVFASIEAKYPGKKIEAKHVEYRRFAFFEVEIIEDNGHHGEEGGDDHHADEVEMSFTISGQEFNAETAIACLDKCAAGTCDKETKENCCTKGGDADKCHKEVKKECCKDGVKCDKCKAHEGEVAEGDDHNEGDDHHDENEEDHH